MDWRRVRLVSGCLFCSAFVSSGPMCRAQQQAETLQDAAVDKLSVPPSASEPLMGEAQQDNSVGTNFLKHLLDDQKSIWTSPASLRPSDATWLMPLGITAGAMFATDTDFSKHLSNSPSRLKNSNNFSNFGLASMVGAGAGLYLLGHVSHDDHKRETGILAAEAAIDSLAVDYALKYTLGRERPTQDNYRGS